MAEVSNSVIQRLGSLEELAYRTETTMSLMLERIKTLEQFAASEARERMEKRQASAGGDEYNRRALAIVNDSATAAAAVAAQAAQQNHSLEAQMRAALTELGAAMQRERQSAQHDVQVVEQRLRGELVTVQQQLLAELNSSRQVTTRTDDGVRHVMMEMQTAIMNEVRHTNAALKSGEERLHGEVVAIHQRYGGELQALATRVERGEVALQALLKDGQSALAGEVGAVLSRVLAIDSQVRADFGTLQRQMATEIGNVHDQIRSVDAAWRTSLTGLSESYQKDWRVHLARQQAVEQQTQRDLQTVERNIAEAHALARTSAEQLSVKHEELRQYVLSLRPQLESMMVFGQEAQRLIRTLEETTATTDETLRRWMHDVERNAERMRDSLEVAMRSAVTELHERLRDGDRERAELRQSIQRGLVVLRDDVSASLASVSASRSAMEHRMDHLESQLLGERETRAAHTAQLTHQVHELRAAEVINNAIQSQNLVRAAQETEGKVQDLRNQLSGVVVTSSAQQAMMPGIASVADVQGLKKSIEEELETLWNEAHRLHDKLGMPRTEVMEAINFTHAQTVELVTQLSKAGWSDVDAKLASIFERVKHLSASVLLCAGGMDGADRAMANDIAGLQRVLQSMGDGRISLADPAPLAIQSHGEGAEYRGYSVPVGAAAAEDLNGSRECHSASTSSGIVQLVPFAHGGSPQQIRLRGGSGGWSGEKWRVRSASPGGSATERPPTVTPPKIKRKKSSAAASDGSAAAASAPASSHEILRPADQTPGFIAAPPQPRGTQPPAAPPEMKMQSPPSIFSLPQPIGDVRGGRRPAPDGLNLPALESPARSPVDNNPPRTSDMVSAQRSRTRGDVDAARQMVADSSLSALSGSLGRSPRMVPPILEPIAPRPAASAPAPAPAAGETPPQSLKQSPRQPQKPPPAQQKGKQAPSRPSGDKKQATGPKESTPPPKAPSGAGPQPTPPQSRESSIDSAVFSSVEEGKVRRSSRKRTLSKLLSLGNASDTKRSSHQEVYNTTAALPEKSSESGAPTGKAPSK